MKGAARGLVPLGLVLLCGIGAAAADPWSQPPLGRYEGRTIVTGTDLRSRPAGMAACLADVLAKVSGDASVLDDPRRAQLQPETIAAGFDYVDRMAGIPHHDEQGSSDRPYWLTVRFDPARLDLALRDLGRAPFAGARATVVPVVTIRTEAGQFLLTQEAARGADHRAALAVAADRVGVPVEVPEAAALTGGIAEAPDRLALLGLLRWSDEEHGWVAQWSAEWHSDRRRWEARGVSFDEAYRVGLRGALGMMAGHEPGETIR